jgi:hypothetical protein
MEYENKVVLMTKSMEYEKAIFEEKLMNKDLVIDNLEKNIYIRVRTKIN